eukprot:CAMPEP_0175132132 /NCGR_PEP_ID=MMETSP0087-20121206/6913_1 /TAXON_ID=136419 /ORGANISM="Unknown Unknown, Strain D1" /LENGTH=452 /DNA_ID=CAMNT_0016414469 /DNA_START=39 /DNA_END=1397 /DNA_ORIENTATION=+
MSSKCPTCKKWLIGGACKACMLSSPNTANRNFDIQPPLERKSSESPANPPVLWKTPSIAELSDWDILDCEPCGSRAENDHDNFWGGRENRDILIAQAPNFDVSVSKQGMVHFTRDEKSLTKLSFLQTFWQRDGVFEDSDLEDCQKNWASAVRAARAFRKAVLICSEQAKASPNNQNGSVYWKSVGFSRSTMDLEYFALCCPAAQALPEIGDSTKFTKNQDADKSEKLVFTQTFRRRVGKAGFKAVPGTNGFCSFKSPSSTLIVPGNTRRHRCAWSPEQGALRNCDGMAHLALALQFRNARVAEDGTTLVRDEKSQFLLTDEELAFGLRLVAREVFSQLKAADTDDTFVWWCTHGHDIPWLHFKVMTTEALLSKKGLGELKEQFTAQHLARLGFDANAVPLKNQRAKVAKHETDEKSATGTSGLAAKGADEKENERDSGDAVEASPRLVRARL